MMKDAFTNAPRLIGITDAAERADVSRRSIRKAIDRGEIGVERIGGRDCPVVADLDRWIGNPSRQRANPRKSGGPPPHNH